jgi:hypothetical protein
MKLLTLALLIFQLFFASARTEDKEESPKYGITYDKLPLTEEVQAGIRASIKVHDGKDKPDFNSPDTFHIKLYHPNNNITPKVSFLGLSPTGTSFSCDISARSSVEKNGELATNYFLTFNKETFMRASLTFSFGDPNGRLKNYSCVLPTK